MTDPILHPNDQHIIVSALRHCREVQSYFTNKTIEWIMVHWRSLDERTQDQLIQGTRLDLRLREEATPEEKDQLNQDQPEWENYLNFIERKINE